MRRRTRIAAACIVSATIGCVTGEPGGPAAPPNASPSPGEVTVSLGAPEMVMRYREQSCEPFDLPDVQTRAFRRSDGRFVLVSGNAPRNYWMEGTGFHDLRRVCQPVLVSHDDPRAEVFDNQEWITSVYREGAVVHALVHNEYHDPVAANCGPGDTSPANPCWYNAVTYARSTDGGKNFVHARGPDHLVAASPERWNPAVPRGAPGPYGYFSASNIVRGKDGAYYTMVFGIPRRDEQGDRGTCVLRTTDLSNPASWRAWNGAGYTLALASAYRVSGGVPCTFVSRNAIGDLHGSLTWNSYLQRYMLVGSATSAISGAGECGTYYALSQDLITWTTTAMLRPGKLPYGRCAGGVPDGSEIYPSLIDHADTTVNFEVTGRTSHLYYVRWNKDLDRDLWRVPVTLLLR